MVQIQSVNSFGLLTTHCLNKYDDLCVLQLQGFRNINIAMSAENVLSIKLEIKQKGVVVRTSQI